MAFDSLRDQRAVDPEPVQPGLLDHDHRDNLAGPSPDIALQIGDVLQQSRQIAARTCCLDILALKGVARAVTSQVARLSPRDTKIAGRADVVTACAAGKSAICMVMISIEKVGHPTLAEPSAPVSPHGILT